MSTFPLKGTAAAAILIAATIWVAPAFADAPTLAPPDAAPTGGIQDGADNALRRTPLSPGAARAADRTHCRDLAAKRRLFGLSRHKFLQRCRKARRKVAPSAPR